jgi:uncharacterized protein YndB with AHSA1/START domain
MVSSTDRIERELLIRAPQERVWRALSDAAEFGDWFGIELDGEFAPGATMVGRIKPTSADTEVAAIQKRHEGKQLTLVVDRIEPRRLFSYRWHPFAIDPTVDYSSEPMTLVTFTLEPQGEHTLVRVVETGFDAIPLARRADAFEANDEGWELMVSVLGKHLAANP